MKEDIVDTPLEESRSFLSGKYSERRLGCCGPMQRLGSATNQLTVTY